MLEQQQSSGPFAAGAIQPRRQQPTAPATGIVEPTDFMESFRRNQDDATRLRNDGVRETQTLEELWARHRAIEQALGRPVPLSQSLAGQPTDQRDSLKNALERIIPTDAINAAILGRPGTMADDEYERRIDEWRRETPAAMEGIESREDIAKRLGAEWYAIRRRADEAAESGATGAAGAFAGQVVGSFQDPVNASMAILTGGVGAGRSLLSRMLVQGAIGGGVEAMGAGERATEAAQYGGPAYKADEAAADILFGAAAGAGFEALGEGAKIASRPIRDALRSTTAPDAVARALSAEIDRASRAYAADAPDPAVRATAVRLDAFDRDAEITGPVDGETSEAARAALQRFEPRPSVEPERELSEIFDTGVPTPETTLADPSMAPGPAARAEASYQGRRIFSGSFDPMTVEADPVAFQYKAGGDAAGVTNRLAGVETWDATAAGRAILFERRDGQVVVADGHQRRALARRLIETGQDTTASLDGFLFRQADGWAVEDVRVVAALKNIREGSGSIMDAAKVFRDAPALINDRSLPVTGDFIASARGLARLSPEAFGAVVNGVIPERFGAVIGELAADKPDLHASLVDLINRGGARNLDDSRALVQEGLLADFAARTGLQADLFGGMPAESSIIARAKLRAAVLRQLRGDARLFSSLVRKADAIEVGGNVLARSENEMRAAMDSAAVAVVDRLSLRSGEVGDVFGAAARSVARGERSLADAVSEVVGVLRASVDDGADLTRFRSQALAPGKPTDMATDALRLFDEPFGEGQAAQVRPKPEDAVAEQTGGPGGLFDDLATDDIEDRAFARLAPCAPGRA